MSTPIIYFGKNKEISDNIIAGLKPEYETVEFFTSTEDGVKGLSGALSGKGAKAVVFGKGFKTSEVEELRKAAGAKVLFLHGGLEQSDIDKFKSGGEGKAPPLEKYGPLAAKKIKGILDEVKGAGQFDQDLVKTW